MDSLPSIDSREDTTTMKNYKRIQNGGVSVGSELETNRQTSKQRNKRPLLRRSCDETSSISFLKME
jgi:hypothetical protein